MVNVGTAFSFLWKMVLPFIPKKAINKMKVLSSLDVRKEDNVMVKNLGRESLEREYGGVLETGYRSEDYDFDQVPTDSNEEGMVVDTVIVKEL